MYSVYASAYIPATQPPHSPNRCLSGNGGTTTAGKSLTRWFLKNTKSWNLLRAVGFGVEKMGRLVWGRSEGVSAAADGATSAETRYDT